MRVRRNRGWGGFRPEEILLQHLREQITAEIIDRCVYGRQECQAETGFSSTSSSVSGDHAMVGYFNAKYHDPRDRYTEDYLNQNHYWTD